MNDSSFRQSGICSRDVGTRGIIGGGARLQANRFTLRVADASDETDDAF
jgi:hypothetical protein